MYLYIFIFQFFVVLHFVSFSVVHDYFTLLGYLLGIPFHVSPATSHGKRDIDFALPAVRSDSVNIKFIHLALLLWN